MRTPITIGISACLFGQNTRYDGGHRHEPLLVEALLARSVALLPLCPEAECGLGIPREPMRLEGDPEKPRLMTITTRRDLTGRLEAWCDNRLRQLAAENLHGFILKSRSPSCGKRVAVQGAAATSPGLFARLVMTRLPTLPMADEEELRDPAGFADFFNRLAAAEQELQEKQR